MKLGVVDESGDRFAIYYSTERAIQAIAVVVVACLTMLVWIFHAKLDAQKTQFWLEISKATAQLLLVSVIGGVVVFFLNARADARRRSEQLRDQRRAEEREDESAEQARRQRLQEVRTDCMKRMVGVANLVRMAPVHIEANGSARTYAEQMRLLLNGGLELRLLVHEIGALGSDSGNLLFGATWIPLRSQLQAMRECLNELSPEFRRLNQAVAERQREAENADVPRRRHLVALIRHDILTSENLTLRLMSSREAESWTARFFGSYEGALALMMRGDPALRLPPSAARPEEPGLAPVARTGEQANVEPMPDD